MAHWPDVKLHWYGKSQRPGRKLGHLFIQGQIVRVVPEDEMVAALIDEAEKLLRRLSPAAGIRR